MEKMSFKSYYNVWRAWLYTFDENLKLENNDDSDADQNVVPNNVFDLLNNNSNNESEIDDDFCDTDNNTNSTSEYEFYFSKDEKTKWYKNFLHNKTKQRAHHITTRLQGAVNAVAKNAKTILDYWK